MGSREFATRAPSARYRICDLAVRSCRYCDRRALAVRTIEGRNPDDRAHRTRSCIADCASDAATEDTAAGYAVAASIGAYRSNAVSAEGRPSGRQGYRSTAAVRWCSIGRAAYSGSNRQSVRDTELRDDGYSRISGGNTGAAGDCARRAWLGDKRYREDSRFTRSDRRGPANDGGAEYRKHIARFRCGNNGTRCTLHARNPCVQTNCEPVYFQREVHRLVNGGSVLEHPHVAQEMQGINVALQVFARFFIDVEERDARTIALQKRIVPRPAHDAANP